MYIFLLHFLTLYMRSPILCLNVFLTLFLDQDYFLCTKYFCSCSDWMQREVIRASSGPLLHLFHNLHFHLFPHCKLHQTVFSILLTKTEDCVSIMPRKCWRRWSYAWCLGQFLSFCTHKIFLIFWKIGPSSLEKKNSDEFPFLEDF